jgi:hypothetical protein
MPKL